MSRLITVVACAISLLVPIPGFAGAPKCRADDPAAAADADAVQAVREQIDTTCPCASFPADGSSSLHGKYVACAKDVVKTAIDAGQLRTKCKGLALYRAAFSTCGYPSEPALGPCLKTTSKGPVCKISRLEKCTSPKGLPCSVHAGCLAAADTNHDGQVTGLDSGECNPLQNCATVNPTQSQIDNAVIGCFNGCSDPLSLQECVTGCAAGGSLYPAAITALTTTCAADPTLTCAGLYAAYLEACDGLPAQPPICDATCSDNPVCESKCGEVAGCTRLAGFAYENCLAQPD